MNVRAKVAKVITSANVAFNVGAEAGIREGDEVTILKRIEIEDPDTKETLGEVFVRKVNLRITVLQAKLCVGEVIDTVPATNPRGRSSLKRVTEDSALVDYRTVLVAVGDPARISHNDDSDAAPEQNDVKESEQDTPDDEPPF